MEDQVELMPRKEKWPMSETKRLPRPRRPQSYWLAALLTMIFCCTPCGIVALIFAYQTDDLYDSKDYAGSVKMSKRALRWIKASVLFNIIFIGFFIVYCIALGYTVQTMLNNIMDNPDV